jgi:hypothetical protein
MDAVGRIFSHMTMSLDGFIADPGDGVGELFGWYDAGPVTVPSADERWSFSVDDGSARMLGRGIPYFGGLAQAPHRFGDPVIIAGRRATHLRYTVQRADAA